MQFGVFSPDRQCTATYLRAHAPPSLLQHGIASFGCSATRGVCKHLGTALDGRAVVTILLVCIALLADRFVRGTCVRATTSVALLALIAASWGLLDPATILRPPTSTKLQRLPRFVGVVDDARWQAYLMRVYGKTFSLAPTEALDLDDFDIFYLDWLAAAGIDVWAYELASDDCCVSLGYIHTPNTTLWRRLHPVHRPFATVAAHTHIEVMHCFHATYERGYWTYHARGSGVWLDTGATIVFEDHDSGNANALAPQQTNRSARMGGAEMLDFSHRHGFDSYQYRRAEYECAAHEVVFARGRGDDVCGGAALRAGFRAEREHKCDPRLRCVRQDVEVPWDGGGGEPRAGRHTGAGHKAHAAHEARRRGGGTGGNSSSSSPGRRSSLRPSLPIHHPS